MVQCMGLVAGVIAQFGVFIAGAALAMNGHALHHNGCLSADRLGDGDFLDPLCEQTAHGCFRLEGLHYREARQTIRESGHIGLVLFGYLLFCFHQRLPRPPLQGKQG